MGVPTTCLHKLDSVACPHMQNFRTLGQPFLGEEFGPEKKKKNAVNSGHYVLPAMPKGSARTLCGSTCVST